MFRNRKLSEKGKEMSENFQSIQCLTDCILFSMLEDLCCLACSFCLALFIQAKGGRLAFLKGDPSEQAVIDGKPTQTLLAYINGDHEYVIFHPSGRKACELSMTKQEDLVFEETGAITLLHLLCFDQVYTVLLHVYGRRQEVIGPSSIPLICVCIR